MAGAQEGVQEGVPLNAKECRRGVLVRVVQGGAREWYRSIVGANRDAGRLQLVVDAVQLALLQPLRTRYLNHVGCCHFDPRWPLIY